MNAVKSFFRPSAQPSSAQPSSAPPLPDDLQIGKIGNQREPSETQLKNFSAFLDVLKSRFASAKKDWERNPQFIQKREQQKSNEDYCLYTKTLYIEIPNNISPEDAAGQAEPAWIFPSNDPNLFGCGSNDAVSLYEYINKYLGSELNFLGTDYLITSIVKLSEHTRPAKQRDHFLISITMEDPDNRQVREMVQIETKEAKAARMAAAKAEAEACNCCDKCPSVGGKRKKTKRKSKKIKSKRRKTRKGKKAKRRKTKRR